MSQVKVNGKPYEVPDSFTFRELGLIKRLSGVRGAELPGALRAGDMEAFAAIAIISIRRAGEEVDEDKFLDSDIDIIEYVSDPVEEPADPTGAAPGGGESVAASAANGNPSLPVSMGSGRGSLTT